MTQTTAPSAKRLILSMLAAPSLSRVEIGTLVTWGALFGIDSPTIRVTASRLLRQGLLASPARGVYQIGPRGKLLSETARAWVTAEQRVREWSGDWLLVHSAHLGRSNKSALRARERAFRLCGFRPWAPGLDCRPANLVEPAGDTRERLLQLGLDSDAIVIVASALPGTRTQELFRLWPVKPLQQAYAKHIRAMERSLKRLPGLPLAAAARETVQVGEAVIRQISNDPMLPRELIDTARRQQMIELMIDYDRVGRRIWEQFNAQS
ncbi:PaaX [Seongchinamella sediminis]|uniref:PaaX n=1 Tax=Seongchinamella sediminis TaxID=2283635 RepID=A0A3L7E074_9GAMM|nr:PaaX [Seongchinamella sediminis]RLQ23168.1 PaaX [Seongchinamella sediminis]